MIDIHAFDFRPSTCCFGAGRLVVALAAVVLATTWAGAQNLPGPPPPDLGPAQAPEAQTPLATSNDSATTVVARVNGAPIFQNEVERGVTAIPGAEKLPDDKLALAQASVLQQIINRDLVHEYLDAQKLTAGDQEVDASMDKLRATLKQQNSNLDDFLARTHQTETSLRTLFAYELGWNKYVEKNTNDETLQALFKQFHEQFDGTERRVSHIVLRPDGVADEAKVKALIDQAKTLRDQINSGSLTFEAAAEKYSAGPSHSHGGDLGFIPNSGVMIEAFSKAAFALKPGEISQPVATAFGVHLIKVTDVKPGKKTWEDARNALQRSVSNYLAAQLVKSEYGKAILEFYPGVPHFKKEDVERGISDSADIAP